MRALFNPPRALAEGEIWEIIERFATSAHLAKRAGFGGVQIHGAHGYLVSQFLSPRHNQRTDNWGGTAGKRMRFGCEVYQAVRSRVGPDFPIGIKINSADFQAGGFTHEEAVAVCQTLSSLGMDLIEISGGSYEKPVMMLGKKDVVRESTRKREAYFLEYAAAIKRVIRCPLMVTGGFRSHAVMDDAIRSGACDLIGLARPLALEPDLATRLLAGQDVSSRVQEITTGIKALDRLFPLEISWYTQQLHRMGRGESPDPTASAWSAIYHTVKDVGLQGLRRVRA
jgi:2,4-dienoyl-CoA reductase-like NADH-dependent reductase (Old Yellow Enzyme family)